MQWHINRVTPNPFGPVETAVTESREVRIVCARIDRNTIFL